MIIRTVCGYDFFEVSSAMQKADVYKRQPLGTPLGHPLGTPFQESSPIPPKEGYKTETKTKKEPPKGGKKESSSGELFPPDVYKRQSR